MKKTIALLLSVCMLAVCFAGCGGEKPAASSAAAPASTPAAAAPASAPAAPTPESSGKLTLYSSDSEEILKVIVPGFEAATGIKVELITAKTGELIKRIESEKEKPIADVLLGSNPSMLSNIKDLFEDYTSANDAQMMEGYQNDSGCFTPYKADGSVLLVNKALIGDIPMKGYKDLLNPALKGKIAMGDSASSSSAFEHLVNILKDFAPEGQNESEEGWQFVKELLTNTDGKILNSSGAVHKGVADGEYTVGLTWEDPAATYLKNGADVEVVYMDEGVVFAAATAQIVKGCENLDNAKKFVDYVTSAEVQDQFGTQLCNRALRKDAKVGSQMPPLSEIKLKLSDRAWATENKAALGEKFQDIVTSLG